MFDKMAFLFGSRKNKIIKQFTLENAALRGRVNELVDLCNEKNSYFAEAISDALRHGSKLTAKHMADRKDYLNGKY